MFCSGELQSPISFADSLKSIDTSVKIRDLKNHAVLNDLIESQTVKGSYLGVKRENTINKQIRKLMKDTIEAYCNKKKIKPPKTYDWQALDYKDKKK